MRKIEGKREKKIVIHGKREIERKHEVKYRDKLQKRLVTVIADVCSAKINGFFVPL